MAVELYGDGRIASGIGGPTVTGHRVSGFPSVSDIAVSCGPHGCSPPRRGRGSIGREPPTLLGGASAET